MKKLLLVILSIAIYTISFGASIVEIKSMPDANEIFLTFGKIEKKISWAELSKISLKGFETFTNRKMNFFERIVFKLKQKKLRKSIGEDGAIKEKRLKKFLTRFNNDETSRFHAGGFVLGFLVGVPGVLIAYIIKDDNQRKRIKWSWIGFATRAVIASILFYLLF